MQRNKFQDSEVRKQAALSLTCDDDGEAGGVDAGGDLLRRGPGAEPARAGLPGDERQDAHLKPRRQETPKLTIQHCTPPTPKPKQEHAKKLSHRNATEFAPPPPPLPNKKSPKRTRQEALTLAGQIDELFNARAREAGARWKGRRRWLFMVGGAGAELVAELESMQEGLGRRRDRKEFGIVTERIESTWIHPNFKRILYVWVL